MVGDADPGPHAPPDAQQLARWDTTTQRTGDQHDGGGGQDEDEHSSAACEDEDKSHSQILGKFEYGWGPIFKVVLEC